MSDINDLEQALLSQTSLAQTAGKLFERDDSNGFLWKVGQPERLFPALRALLPFAVEDTVALIKAPDCGTSSTHGWFRSKHFLVPGAKAKVKSIEFYDGRFSAYLCFENESWVDDKGVVNPIPEERRHVYGLTFDYLVKVLTP